MKTEIILLLDKGFKPKKIAEITNYNLGTIYYYKRQYLKGKKITEEILNKIAKEIK